jgi:peptidoglycan-associated lipoprotein
MRLSRFFIIAAVVLLASGCVCRSKVGPENIPVASAGDILTDINFAFDSYKIDSAGLTIAKRNAEWLLANPNATVQIEGHCDERGTNEYNMALGANRAKAAMDAIRANGVEASRMSTVSYGEELPLDPRHNEEAWAKNRRAHFNVHQ